MKGSPRLVHLTTTDMSLDWLLGPQLRAFAEAGYEVIGMSAPGPHVDAIAAAGVRHVPIPALTRSTDPRNDFVAVAQLIAALRRYRPDILHTHNPKPGILGRVIGRTLRIPLVVNTQHGLYAQPDDPLRRRVGVYAAERIAAAFADVELVQNEEDVRTLVETLRVPASKVHLLGNGVDTTRFSSDSPDPAARAELRRSWGAGDDDVVVGVVGRLVTEKGAAEVFQAARLVTAGGVRFVWVGPSDTSKSDAVDADSLARAEADGVILAGSRSDMPEVYSAFDLFVSASWREGFPRSVMEASAMGLPVIATDIRGNRQAVRHGRTGLLVPVRDPAALAAGVDELVSDRTRRATLGQGALGLARTEFDQNRVIARTLDAYRNAPRHRSTGRLTPTRAAP